LEVPGVDFDKTFTLALKKSSLLALLTYAAHLDLEIHQMDVKSAFLNGILKEEIYMEAPPGLSIPDGMVFHLKKTIYGL
jgi:Reverse transcriptase (RNA-dependent DNA polymerase)